MVVFAIQLGEYALHEFNESSLVPGIDNAWWHACAEDLAEGLTAQTILLALVVMPTVWLAMAYWRVLAYWRIGVLAYWRIGVLAYWQDCRVGVNRIGSTFDC